MRAMLTVCHTARRDLVARARLAPAVPISIEGNTIRGHTMHEHTIQGQKEQAPAEAGA
jgi:hypothetical protein